LNLKSAKKYTTRNGISLTRTKPVQDTLAEIIPLCEKIGITRISDITHMDRLCIPNYSAVLPGTEDSIWVYSGKGPTNSHAKASALMEAIERYCSLSSNYSKKFIRGSYSELSRSYRKVLHPAEVVEPVNQDYTDGNSIMDFISGFDVIRGEQVLVPAQLAFSKYSANPPATYVFPYSHTNGLASGNTLEEAVCHAFCEVIERDASSIADLCASSIPYSILEKIISSLREGRNGGYPVTQIPAEDKFVDDSSIFSDVNISEIAKEFEPIGSLVKKFAYAGVPLLVKNITQEDIGIPTFVASSSEWISHNYGYFAKGYGTHPDARIALMRAITEVSQTRAANIQGARDNLKKVEYKENDEIYKRRWQFMPAPSSLTVKFSKIKSYINTDILDDIKVVLKGMKKAGLKRGIIVDLTNPRVEVPVVRAIVPGLETFEVAKSFMRSQLIMGRRAKKAFCEFNHS
jgi:thioglycine synthase